jgi:hypothetical protein
MHEFSLGAGSGRVFCVYMFFLFACGSDRGRRENERACMIEVSRTSSFVLFE